MPSPSGPRNAGVAVTMRPPLTALDSTPTPIRQATFPMSRAHERAYRLLAEKMRLSDWARRSLYAIIAASVASGVWWLVVHYGDRLLQSSDDLHRLALEGVALKVHGATGFFMLVALGAMSANHVRRGWAMARNRLSGSLVVGSTIVLIVSAYALYYLVDDTTRPPVSILHWLIGLVLVPLLVIHIAAGRRSRGIALDATTAASRSAH